MWQQYANLPRPVLVLCLGSLINRSGTFLVVFLTLYLKDALGHGIQFATWCMGAYGLGALAASLVGGHLADLIGRRFVLLVALFGGPAILLVFSTLAAPWAMMACLAAFALIGEMYRPAASAMIADLVETGRRPQAYGLMYLSINLGFSVAPILGGLLLRHVAFRWLFWCDALTTACYGTIVLCAIRETLPARSRRHGGVGAPDEPAVRVTPVRWTEALRTILTDVPFAVFCAGTFCIAVVYMQSMSTFPLYLRQYGIGPAVYGRILAVNGMMIVFLQIPFTSVVSRFDRSTMVVLASVVTATGFGLTGYATGPWLFAGTVVIWTCGEMMAAPLSPTIVADLAPERLRARYMGVFTMSFSGANMIGAPLGGFLLERFGGAYLWRASFLVALVSAVLYASIRTRIRRGHG